MDKSWINYCTMSIVHFMAYPATMSGEGPLLESITKLAEDPFFGAVEIGLVKDPKVRAEIRAVLQAAHMQVGIGGQSAVLMGKLNPNSLDEAERKHAVETMKGSLDLAAELGAKRMAFLSGKDPGDTDRPKAFDALIKSIKELSKYGRDKGVALTMEVFDRTVDKKSLMGPSEYCVDFSKVIRADYPEFGLMYDLSHMPLLSEQSMQALSAVKDHLVHIHIGNCVVDPALKGYGDLHPRFGWPGGCNDVPELTDFLQSLFKVGYLGDKKTERPWVGFEIKPQAEGETPELVIAGTKRVWMDAWSRA
jgi:sugar phosphate isomerase/epimerase